MVNYRSVHRETLRHMTANREVEMAFIQGYIELFVFCRQKATLHAIDGKAMEEVRIKAADFIFERKKRQWESTRKSNSTCILYVLLIALVKSESIIVGSTSCRMWRKHTAEMFVTQRRRMQNIAEELGLNRTGQQLRLWPMMQTTICFLFFWSLRWDRVLLVLEDSVLGSAGHWWIRRREAHNKLRSGEINWYLL